MDSPTPINDNKNNYSDNYKYNIYSGIIASLILILTTAFVIPLIKKLGGTDFHITLYSALPPFITMLSLIPATILLQSAKNFRHVVLFVYLLAKSFYLLFIAAILLPSKYAPLFLVILFAFQSLPNNLFTSGFGAWIGHIFTSKEQNIANGKRAKYALISTSLGSVTFGYLLGYFNNNSITIANYQIDSLTIYCLMFLLAFFICFIEFYFLCQFKGVKQLKQSDKFLTNLKNAFKQENRHHLKNLFIYLLAVLIFYIFWYFPQAIFNLNMADRLRAGEVEFAYIALIGAISQFFLVPVWIKIAKQYGTLKALSFCMLAMAINPFIHAFSPNIYYYIALQTVAAFSLSGINFLTANALLLVTSKEKKALYLSIFTTVISIVMFLAPFCGNQFRKLFPDYNQGIIITLLITAAGRIIGSGIFFLYCLKINKLD